MRDISAEEHRGLVRCCLWGQRDVPGRDQSGEREACDTAEGAGVCVDCDQGKALE